LIELSGTSPVEKVWQAGGEKNNAIEYERLSLTSRTPGGSGCDLLSQNTEHPCVAGLVSFIKPLKKWQGSLTIYAVLLVGFQEDESG